MPDRPQTLAQLKQSGYQPLGVKQEMRRNLMRFLKTGEPLFPEIIGYDDTVLPQIQNAILSQHDVLFLGLRGQGKTRILRLLTRLLDEAIPVLSGSEIHDDPLAPISKYGRDLVASQGDACPIEWVGRHERYHEKLATPDVTIADLVGEVDLIKHAEGRHLSSEDVMHFGLIPRSHRGIFCINELPDLSPKIQVGLFNVLEERDIQIRGFPIRLDLDLCLVFSANPEDYTNRGRIVTPLKDRIGSVIRTHYPRTRALGVQITDENAWVNRDADVAVRVPTFLKQIVEETARLARTSPHVNQASGVSVRMSIANLENVVSNAERRGLTQGIDSVVARVSDLSALDASSRGKMELSLTEDVGEEDRLLSRLVEEAVKNIFDLHLKPKQFRAAVEYFENGPRLTTGDHLTADQLLESLRQVPGLEQQIDTLASELEPEWTATSFSDEFRASIGEWILEGLHCHNRLNKRPKSGSSEYGF